MGKKINIKTLIDFSNGNYSYNNYLQIKSWFNEASSDAELKEQLYSQWSEIIHDNSEVDQSLNHVFEKIQHNILMEKKKSNKRNMVWNIYRYAAAILLIPMMAFSIWALLSKQENETATTAKSWIEINAPEAARVEFLLPDSTKGWLNSGSKLKYATDFNENRKVELNGEAYFEVTHREQSEFIVSLNKLNVKVLGTIFNISDYTNDLFTDIVLLKGKVEISDKTGAFNQMLSPGEKITYDIINQSANISEVDAKRYAAWKDGFLIIDNEPLGQAIGRIERWYNAEIVIENEALKSYRFKATFKDEPLEEVLRLISLTTPLKYTIEKRDTDKGGVLKKKKVIIKLKN